MDKELQDAFKNLLQIAQLDRMSHPRMPWNDYKKKTKAKKVYTYRRLREVLVTLIAPGAEEEFMQLYSSMTERRSAMDLKFEAGLKALMIQVQAQFMAAQSRRQKRLTLSLVAGCFPYGVVSHYIPGISYGLYRKAKILSLNHFYEEPPETPIIEKYDPVKVDTFVTFLTRFVISFPDYFDLVVFQPCAHSGASLWAEDGEDYEGSTRRSEYDPDPVERRDQASLQGLPGVEWAASSAHE